MSTAPKLCTAVFASRVSLLGDMRFGENQLAELKAGIPGQS